MANMADMADMTLEELEARHREENKSMNGKVMALKKAVPKGDKRRKKGTQEEIIRLEAELDARHEKEMTLLLMKARGKGSDVIDDMPSLDSLVLNEGENEAALVTATEGGGGRISKAAKRRAKKEAEAKERRLQAELDAAGQINYGDIETEKMNAEITRRGLRIVDIATDGNCLYNAIVHQLAHHYPSMPSLDWQGVRRITADYLRMHMDDFVPFLATEDGNIMLECDYEGYCDRVENTATWGGQVEIQAVSSAMQIAIEIVQADGPPIIVGNEFKEDNKPPLQLSYHRHKYSLGEHYNALLSVDSNKE